MNFSTSHDIDAPVSYVFQRVTNFAAYERQALRNGAQVTRVDGNGPIGVGATWDAAFTFRGKDRRLQAVVTELVAPETLTVETTAQGLNSQTRVTLVGLSQKTTRVTVKVTIKAKTLPARLMMQSLRLAKKNLNRRFRKRIREQLKTVATDYQRGV